MPKSMIQGFINDIDTNTPISDVYCVQSEIDLIDKVVVDKSNVNRLDIILQNYYPDNIEWLPFLYDFNNISNPSDVKIGMTIYVPYMSQIVDYLEPFELENIAGIRKQIPFQQTNNKTVTETIAVPKLNIKQQRVKFDSVTGTATY